MAGGTWIDQNKVRPGVYINYKSKPASLAQMGERGTVAIAQVLDWGERSKWYIISDPSDCEQFGHSIADDACLFVRQILKGTNRTAGASKILLWSLETPLSVTQTVTANGFTIMHQAQGEVKDLVFGTNNEKMDYNESYSYSVTLINANAISNPEIVNNDGKVALKFDVTSASGEIAGANVTYTDPGAQKATATIGNLVATARYFGTFGNRLSVAISAGASSTFNVQTKLDGQIVDSQVVSAITDLVSNSYIDWSGTGDLAVNSGVVLSGGTNGEAGASDYAAFLSALEPEKFDIVICDSSDASIKASFCDFVKRLSNDEGQRCQAVVSNLSNDSECVISVYNQTVTLNDGTELDSQKLTWWVGGASAGANVNESLTYASHPDAVDVTPKLTASQQESAINNGHIAFISQFGKIQILTDINTFTTFSTNKGRAFRKNRVVRTVFGLCNDIYKTFALYHIGVTDNNDDGRAALKGEILDLMSRYEGNRALQNVNPDDVTVIKGIDSDAVVIEIYCQPVDSIEKIYVNITIS